MKYIEDIDRMKFYDWCGVAKQQLTRSIASNMNQIDKASRCMIVLLHWICEHTSIIKPNDKNVIPRFAKWNITYLGQQLANSSFHDLKNIVESNLKYTNEEQKIHKQLLPHIEDEDEDEEPNFEEQEQIEISKNEEETMITKIYQQLLPQTEGEDKINKLTLRNKSRLKYLKRKKNQLSKRYSVSV